MDHDDHLPSLTVKELLQETGLHPDSEGHLAVAGEQSGNDAQLAMDNHHLYNLYTTSKLSN